MSFKPIFYNYHVNSIQTEYYKGRYYIYYFHYDRNNFYSSLQLIYELF